MSFFKKQGKINFNSGTHDAHKYVSLQSAQKLPLSLRLKKHSLSRYNCDRIKPRFQILQIFCITVYSTQHITRKKKPVFFKKRYRVLSTDNGTALGQQGLLLAPVLWNRNRNFFTSGTGNGTGTVIG
jgi:hypothetical protein